MSNNPLIIAIDGPSGSGKSTVGRMLARALKLLYVDTGSMYRAIALSVLEAKVEPQDHEAVVSLARNIQIDFQGDPDSQKTLLAGRDVSELIRSDRVTNMSSVVSAIPDVRRAMVALQREMGKRGAVLNGRDIATVVFPDADYKFFLTASPEERASRRYQEDQVKGSQTTLDETLAEMTARDHRDTTRTDSPLKIADEAIVIDSTGKSIDEVLAAMMQQIK